jgi:hypothetical protein
VGAFGRVMSCQALNVAASREPSSIGAYPMLKAPGLGFREPGYVLRQAGPTGGEILPAHVYRGGVDYTQV